jgi:protein-S-isoprenylcysteine O-methyltransferase Ste14
VTGSTASQPQLQQSDADTVRRIGAWLFRHRTVIPLPLALAVLLLPSPASDESSAVVLAGIGLVALGEGIRLWGVRHIGAISRTRSSRLGPLIASGPFAFVRNPLYIGNITLWTGFALSARLVWLAPLFITVLLLEYAAIVRWEEQVLEERLGDRYRRYADQVPRWIPRPAAVDAPHDADVFSWRETFYSERGTLIAIAIGYVLLLVKLRF